MGYDLTEARIHGRTSNHNSARDDHDRAAWNELLDEIQSLADSERFKCLDLHLSLPRLPVLGYGHREPQ